MNLTNALTEIPDVTLSDWHDRIRNRFRWPHDTMKGNRDMRLLRAIREEMRSRDYPVPPLHRTQKEKRVEGWL